MTRNDLVSVLYGDRLWTASHLHTHACESVDVTHWRRPRVIHIKFFGVVTFGRLELMTAASMVGTIHVRCGFDDDSHSKVGQTNVAICVNENIALPLMFERNK